MFRMLEKPLYMDKNIIMRRYRDGAIIFYQETHEVSGYVKVYAEADYGEKINTTECIYNIMKSGQSYMEGVAFEVRSVEPVKKTNIDTHGRFVLERSNFWTDCTDAIRLEYLMYKNVFDAEPEMVRFYYSNSNDWRCVTYYGSSCEAYSVKRLENRVKHKVFCVTYEEYLQKMAEMKKKLAEEERDEQPLRRGEDGVSVLRRSIATWKERVVFRDFYAYMADRVKGQKELMKVAVSVYTYLSCIAEGRPTDSNMLLAAPSGSGKTETFRVLRDYFKKEIPELPVYQVDMTSITEEGFKGADTREIVAPLGRCHEPEGIGLVFLDEFDKKLIPSFSQHGNDVNAAVQAQILTLLEGRRIRPTKDGPEVDTTNTMFIGLGSFDVCRKNRSVNTHALGFGATEEKMPDHYDKITRDEMIALGASHELIGRFSTIVNYYKLSDEVVDQIIDRNLIRIATNLGCAIEITKEKRDEMHGQANGKFGCRMLYNDLHDQVLEVYAELLMDGAKIGRCTIVLDADGRTKCLTSKEATEKEWQEAV